MREEFIKERITQLRLQKGVSEYQMSYDLGHSRGYIYNISSGKALPPLREFLAICDYFGITPQEFFDETVAEPILLNQIATGAQKLSQEDQQLILALIERLAQE